MANTVQAKKRARQAEVRRERNASAKSAMRTTVKKVLKAIESKDKNAAQTALRVAASALDSTARKGMIARNAAARTKSRLSKRIAALA